MLLDIQRRREKTKNFRVFVGAAEECRRDTVTCVIKQKNTSMDRTELYGSPPVIDNQGKLGVCVSFAIAKAIVNGLYHEKWNSMKIDVDQKIIREILLNKVK